MATVHGDYSKLAAELRASQDPDVTWTIKRIQGMFEYRRRDEAYLRLAEYMTDKDITDLHKAIAVLAYERRTGDQDTDWLSAQRGLAIDACYWHHSRAAREAIDAVRRTPQRQVAILFF